MATIKARGKRERVALERVRPELTDLLNRVQFKGERIVVTRYEKDAVALVSIADLEKIEAA